MEPKKPIKASPLSCVPPSPDPPSDEDYSQEQDDAQHQQSVLQHTQYDDDEEDPDEVDDEDPDEADDGDPEEEEEEEEGDGENDKNMINNSNNAIVPDSVSDMESDSETHNDDYTVKPVWVSAKAGKDGNDDGDDAVDSKKVKNNRSGGGSIKPFSRIWSLKDEIGMLQGMIDYKKKYKKEATSNQDDFYNFVKDKLEFGFSKTQVKEKLRRVRGKYTNTLKKAVDGKDPVLSDPHEVRLFQLGKQVWAGRINSNSATAKKNSGAKENVTAKGNGAAKAKENEIAKETSTVNGKGNASANGKENATGNGSIVVALSAGETVLNGGDDVKAEKSKRMEVERDYRKLYPNLMAGFENEKSLPRVPLIKGFKRCLSRCESSELEEWDKRWKKVCVAEEEAYLNRIALVAEQTRWFKEEFNSSQ